MRKTYKQVSKRWEYTKTKPKKPFLIKKNRSESLNKKQHISIEIHTSLYMQADQRWLEQRTKVFNLHVWAPIVRGFCSSSLVVMVLSPLVLAWAWMEDRKSRRSKNQSSRSSYSFAGGSREFFRSLLLPPPFSTVALLVTALFLLPVQSISFLYRLLHQTPSLVIHQLGFRIETKRRIGMRKRCGLVGFFFKSTNKWEIDTLQLRYGSKSSIFRTTSIYFYSFWFNFQHIMR